MSLLGIALAVWVTGGFLAFLARRRPREATLVGVGSALAGAGFGAGGAITTLLGAGPESWSGAWAVPLGSLSLRLDPLASVFILPICLVGGACALYGGAYLRPYADERPVGAPLAGYNLLLASMTVVCLADHLLLFLVAWELMTLSSYALVVHEHGLESVREAGRRYLIAAHLATAALLLLVLLLSADSGSLELSDLSPGTAAAPTELLFLLALAGFGNPTQLLRSYLVASFPCTSGCPMRTPPRPATCRRSCRRSWSPWDSTAWRGSSRSWGRRHSGGDWR